MGEIKFVAIERGIIAYQMMWKTHLESPFKYLDEKLW